MHLTRHLIGASAACVAVAFCSASLRADYVLGGGASGTYRIANDGTFVVGYFPPPDVESEIEALGIDHVVMPDFTTLYQFTNTLGFSHLTLAFETATGAYLADQTLHSGPCCFPPPNEDFIANARMPLIRATDPLGAGDLFVISGNFGYPDGSMPQIKRYNRATDSYVESINPPTSQGIYDIAFGPDNRLFMAAEHGIFIYEETTAGFELLSASPLLGSVTGTMAFLADGLLLVRDLASGNVNRYTAQGQFVDTLIPAATIPENLVSYGSSFIRPGRGGIHFGADGNVHLPIDSRLPGDDYLPVHYIGRYDGTTGALLSMIKIDFGAFGRVTYLPVPEPTSQLLVAIGLALFLSRRHWIA